MIADFVIKWYCQNPRSLSCQSILTFFLLITYSETSCMYVIYRVVGNWWYKRKGGDSTRKKKSKIWNKNFSFEALFSRKSTLAGLVVLGQ